MTTATNESTVLRHEAVIFSNYLIGVAPDDPATSLYIKALRYRPGDVSKIDKARLAFVRNNPWMVRFVDSGLALVDPSSEVRRRIYIMFSVLEASPHYHNKFLPARRKWWYIFVVGLIGVKGVLKTAIGAVVVKAIK
jgi:hypothetical protein